MGQGGAAKLSRHLAFVLEQLTTAEAGSHIRKLVPEGHLAEVKLLIHALGSASPKDDGALEDQLMLTSRLFVAANTLMSRYNAEAEAAKDRVEACEAVTAIRTRASYMAEGAKATDKAIEAAVDMDPEVVRLKAEEVSFKEMYDVMYGLREAVRMRFEVLTHVSNNRRATMKIEG